MLKLLLLAAKMALPSNDTDFRDFWLGCVGVRNDGVLVYSKNGAACIPTVNRFQCIPNSHAEGRILNKLDYGAIIYVARVKKKDKTLALARPCPTCQNRIKARGIKKVYYSINDTQYGVWDIKTNKDKIITCR